MRPADERNLAIIDNLSSLIISHGRNLGSQQHHPMQDADQSDEIIAEESRIVAELRDLRTRFENLVMGVVDEG